MANNKKGNGVGLVYLAGNLLVFGSGIAGLVAFGPNLITILSMVGSGLVISLFVVGIIAGIGKELARRESAAQLDQLANSLEQVIIEIERQERAQAKGAVRPQRAPGGYASDNLGGGLEQIG